MAAVRRMVKKALQDPLNQRFQLITNTTLPIRPPSAVHSQLLAQQSSHFDGLEKVMKASVLHVGRNKRMPLCAHAACGGTADLLLGRCHLHDIKEMASCKIALWRPLCTHSFANPVNLSHVYQSCCMAEQR